MQISEPDTSNEESVDNLAAEIPEDSKIVEVEQSLLFTDVILK